MIRKQQTIRILSPAYVWGAGDARNLGPAGEVAEAVQEEGIRGPGVMAGLRWWLRAIAGGIVGTGKGPLREIRELENGLFGSTEGAGRVWLRIREPEGGWAIVPAPRELPLWQRYLAYGMEKRPFLEAEQSFGVDLLARGAQEGEAAEALARLWGTLNGGGGRWRHGLGSMGLVEGGELWRGEAMEWETRLRGMFEAARSAIQELGLGGGTPGEELAAYPAASATGLRMRLSDTTYGTWQEGLEAVWRAWRDARLPDPARERHTDNSRKYHDFLGVRTSLPDYPPVRFAGLGLPIPFSVKNPRPDGPRRLSAVMTADKARRRSSPIWFRLLPARSGFHILAMLWDCVYLPEGMKIILNKGRTEEAVDPASEFQSEAREYFDGWLKGWTPITPLKA